MASCSKIPGQPGPKTTCISPAGAGSASSSVVACRIASSTWLLQVSVVRSKSYPYRPPEPELPLSIWSSSPITTVTLRRTRGRISPESSPPGRIIWTACQFPVREAMTCRTRASLPRAYASMSWSNFTLVSNGVSCSGLSSVYNCWLVAGGDRSISP